MYVCLCLCVLVEVWVWVLEKENRIQMPKTDIELEWLRFLLDTLCASIASDVPNVLIYFIHFCFSLRLLTSCISLYNLLLVLVLVLVLLLISFYYHFSNEILRSKQADWIERLNYIHMLKSKSVWFLCWCEHRSLCRSLSRSEACNHFRSISASFESISLIFFLSSFSFGAHLILFSCIVLLPPRSFCLVGKLRV